MPKYVNPRLPQQTRVVEIAAVEDHRCFVASLISVEVGAAELAPLGHDGERVGSVQRFVGALAKRKVGALAIDAARLCHRHRVVGPHRQPASHSASISGAARRLAHVVGIGLEGKAPHARSSCP